MQEFYSITMIFSIATFTLSTVSSPGPNNIMLLSSGLTFGFKRTIPYMLGIMLGFPFMVLLVGLGLGLVFEKFPFIFSILKIVGILYLFWMAFKIANNKGKLELKEGEESKPFTFLQSAAFQWVNPKAWVMAITAISIFVTSKDDSFIQVLIIALIYLLSSIFSTSAWTAGGVVLKKFVKDEKTVRILNIIMAILLVASVLPIILE